MLQGVSNEAPQRVAHLARLTGTLVGGGALPLSLLKVVTRCASSTCRLWWSSNAQALSTQPLIALMVFGGQQWMPASLGRCWWCFLVLPTTKGFHRQPRGVQTLPK